MERGHRQGFRRSIQSFIMNLVGGSHDQDQNEEEPTSSQAQNVANSDNMNQNDTHMDTTMSELTPVQGASPNQSHAQTTSAISQPQSSASASAFAPTMDTHTHNSNSNPNDAELSDADSMPRLQSVSDSSDDENDDDDYSDEDVGEVREVRDQVLAGLAGLGHPQRHGHGQGQRRPRGAHDLDEERDRRHPFHRVSSMPTPASTSGSSSTAYNGGLQASTSTSASASSVSGSAGPSTSQSPTPRAPTGAGALDAHDPNLFTRLGLGLGSSTAAGASPTAVPRSISQPSLSSSTSNSNSISFNPFTFPPAHPTAHHPAPDHGQGHTHAQGLGNGFGLGHGHDGGGMAFEGGMAMQINIDQNGRMNVVNAHRLPAQQHFQFPPFPPLPHPHAHAPQPHPRPHNTPLQQQGQQPQTQQGQPQQGQPQQGQPQQGQANQQGDRPVMFVPPPEQMHLYYPPSAFAPGAPPPGPIPVTAATHPHLAPLLNRGRGGAANPATPGVPPTPNGTTVPPIPTGEGAPAPAAAPAPPPQDFAAGASALLNSLFRADIPLFQLDLGMLGNLGELPTLGAFGFGGLGRDVDDVERARMMIERLEVVPAGLVRRLERVGKIVNGGGNGSGEGDGMGPGDGGCAICWERLLPEEGEGDETLNAEAPASVPETAAASASTSSTVPQPEAQPPAAESTTDTPADPSTSTSTPPAPPTPQPAAPENKIISLPCSHIFHSECLVPWFSKRMQTSCPTCRFQLDPERLTEGFGARMRRMREREAEQRGDGTQAQAQTPGQAQGNTETNGEANANAPAAGQEGAGPQPATTATGPTTASTGDRYTLPGALSGNNAFVDPLPQTADGAAPAQANPQGSPQAGAGYPTLIIVDMLGGAPGPMPGMPQGPAVPPPPADVPAPAPEADAMAVDTDVNSAPQPTQASTTSTAPTPATTSSTTQPQQAQAPPASEPTTRVPAPPTADEQPPGALLMDMDVDMIIDMPVLMEADGPGGEQADPALPPRGLQLPPFGTLFADYPPLPPVGQTGGVQNPGAAAGGVGGVGHGGGGTGVAAPLFAGLPPFASMSRDVLGGFPPLSFVGLDGRSLPHSAGAAAAGVPATSGPAAGAAPAAPGGPAPAGANPTGPNAGPSGAQSMENIIMRLAQEFAQSYARSRERAGAAGAAGAPPNPTTANAGPAPAPVPAVDPAQQAPPPPVSAEQPAGIQGPAPLGPDALGGFILSGMISVAGPGGVRRDIPLPPQHFPSLFNRDNIPAPLPQAAAQPQNPAVPQVPTERPLPPSPPLPHLANPQRGMPPFAPLLRDAAIATPVPTAAATNAVAQGAAAQPTNVDNPPPTDTAALAPPAPATEANDAAGPTDPPPRAPPTGLADPFRRASLFSRVLGQHFSEAGFFPRLEFDGLFPGAPPRPGTRPRPSRGERMARPEWSVPPASGPSIRQRVEKMEREAGLRCADVSCGVGPSDEEPDSCVGDDGSVRLVKQVAIIASGGEEGEKEEDGEGKGKGKKLACEHTFHPACLVSAERAQWKGDEEERTEGKEMVDVTCPVCRSSGSVLAEDWREGVAAL